VEQELKIFFPYQFEGKNVIYNTALINKLKARISWILDDEGAKEQEQVATNELLRLIKPTFWNLNREGNADVDIEVGFEQFMMSVAEHTKEDLNTITTFKFYTLLKHINKKQSDA
jgi:hypothetical protein